MNCSEKKVKNISLVIPCYDEKNVIQDTIENAKCSLDSMGLESYEIIVVDDGSNDGSGDIARQCGVKVLVNPHNVGYGRSLKNGIWVAKFDTIVIVDGDGTYPLEKIPLLIAKYENNFDMVVGARQGINYWESWYKNIFRTLLKGLVEFVSGTKVPDVNSGFRVFSKKTIMTHFDNLCDVFSFTTSMTLVYTLTKKYISYIPIEYRQRVGKTKVRIVRDTLGTLQYIVENILLYNPIKIFLILSGLIILLSAILIFIGLVYGPFGLIELGIEGILYSIVIFALGLLAYLVSMK